MGLFCPNVSLDTVGALALLIELLEVDRTKATYELRQCRGPCAINLVERFVSRLL